MDPSMLRDRGVFLGRTRASLSDIRSFNRKQSSVYELHSNDCRHYVNNLCRFVTGEENAIKRLFRKARTEFIPPFFNQP